MTSTILCEQNNFLSKKTTTFIYFPRALKIYYKNKIIQKIKNKIGNFSICLLSENTKSEY